MMKQCDSNILYVLLTCTRFGVHLYNIMSLNEGRIKPKPETFLVSNYAENFIAHFRKVSRDIPNYLKNAFKFFVTIYENEIDSRQIHTFYRPLVFFYLMDKTKYYYTCLPIFIYILLFACCVVFDFLLDIYILFLLLNILYF